MCAHARACVCVFVCVCVYVCMYVLEHFTHAHTHSLKLDSWFKKKKRKGVEKWDVDGRGSQAAK